MATKITNQTKNTSLILLNILLFLLVLIIVLIIAFYQLFVDKNYHYLGTKFLTPSFFTQFSLLVKEPQEINCLNSTDSIIFQKDKKVIIWHPNNNQEKELFSLGDEEIIGSVLINKHKSLLAFVSRGENFNLSIYNFNTNVLSKTSLDKQINKAAIINFDQTDGIYLSYKSQDGESWTIARADDRGITPVIQNIIYPGEELTRAIEPIKEAIIYPVCQKNCQMILYNITTKQARNITIANVDYAPEIDDLQILFYDETIGRIFYQQTNKKISYITDFQGYLWHNINLQLGVDNLIKINGNILDYQGRKKLLASSDDKKQVYLYDIDYIGLKVIDIKAEDQLLNNQFNLPTGCILVQNKQNEIYSINSNSSKISFLSADKKYLIAY